MTDMTDMTEKTSPTTRASAHGGGKDIPVVYLETAGIILQAWPTDKRCQPRQVVMAMRQDGMQPDAASCARVAEAARRWVDAYEAQGRTQYLQRLDTWISSGAWREEPPEAPRAKTKNGEIAVTGRDMRAIISQLTAAHAIAETSNTKGQDEDEQYPF